MPGPRCRKRGMTGPVVAVHGTRHRSIRSDRTVQASAMRDSIQLKGRWERVRLPELITVG